MSTKARILATAEEVFAAKGFKGASTREIAARARVNISSLHYHWDSKETLYTAVFRDIYERIFDLVRAVGKPLRAAPQSVDLAVEITVGRLFDFFNAHPTIPKLLLRRLVEDDQTPVEIERDILAPAWRVFTSWARTLRSQQMQEPESTLFMLTVHSILLLFALDSKEFRRQLGGSVRSPETQKQVRSHITRMVRLLLESD